MREKKMVKFVLASIILANAILFHSCFREEFAEDTRSNSFSLNPKYILPLGHGKLSITDLVKETDTIRYTGDTIEIYLNKDSLLTLSGEDFFDMPDQTTQDLVFDLGNRSAYNDSTMKSVPLNALGTLLFPVALSGMNNGTNEPFPAITNENTGNIPLDSMETFDWIEITSGIMRMTVKNNLPVTVSSLQFNIRNVDDNSLVADYNFTNISAGGSSSLDRALDDKILQNETYIDIQVFATPGSGGSSVLIDFSDDLDFTLKMFDIKVRRGRAILPDQIFDTDTTSIHLNLEDDEELKTLELATGHINYRLYSYIEEDMAMRIYLPNTTKSGITIDTTILIQEMSSGPTVGQIDLSGSISQLENNGIPAIYVTSLVSSGNMVEFNFSDTVNYYSTIEKVDLTIKSAIGYFGKDTFNIANENYENDLAFFKRFEGEAEFTNPQINIKYSNSYGIPIALGVDMSGEFENEENVELDIPTVDFKFPDNVEDDPVQEIVNYNKNSLPGITNFFRFPPADIISFNGMAHSNRSGKTTRDNFIHNRSKMVFGIEFKLPLELRAEDIVLRDTFPFDLFSNESENTENKEEEDFELGIKEASLAFKIKNGFPLDANLTAILYDSIHNITLDTVEIGIFTAADVDNFGIVIPAQVEEKSGTITINAAFVDNARYNANKLIIIGKLNTTKDSTGKAQSVKILTTYNIEFKAGIVAKISIKTSTNK